jgi:transcriptional regulator with XRE-family HTH domain
MDEAKAKRLGARITLLREEKGMSLGDVATAAGVAKSYLSKMEKGEALNPGLATLAAIASALHLTVHDLLPRAEATSSGPAERGDTEGAVMFETIKESIPKALEDFIREQVKNGDPIPDDTIRALAMLKLRGKRPETVDDYRLLYGMLRRIVS